jgi:hypothetical protein
MRMIHVIVLRESENLDLLLTSVAHVKGFIKQVSDNLVTSLVFKES